MSSRKRKKATEPLRDKGRAQQAAAARAAAPAPADPGISTDIRASAPPVPPALAARPSQRVIDRATQISALPIPREATRSGLDEILRMAWAMARDRVLPHIAEYVRDGHRQARQWQQVTEVEVARAMEAVLSRGVRIRASLEAERTGPTIRVVAEAHDQGAEIRERFSHSELCRAHERRIRDHGYDAYERRIRDHGHHDRVDAQMYTMAEMRRAAYQHVSFYDRPNSLTPEEQRKRATTVGVDKLVAICRVIANAQTLALAAGLSLRSAYWVLNPHASYGVRYYGLCARHGLLINNEWLRIGAPDTCPHCDRARDAVELLITFVRRVFAARAEAHRLAVDALVTVARQAAAVLWEALDDFTKRATLLEVGASRIVAEPEPFEPLDIETDGSRAIAPPPDEDDYAARCALLDMGDARPASAGAPRAAPIAAPAPRAVEGVVEPAIARAFERALETAW